MQVAETSFVQHGMQALWYRLSTLIVLSFVAGGLLCANLTPCVGGPSNCSGPLEPQPPEWGPLVGYGCPFVGVVKHPAHTMFEDNEVDYYELFLMDLCFNLAFALGILTIAGFFCKAWHTQSEILPRERIPALLTWMFFVVFAFAVFNWMSSFFPPKGHWPDTHFQWGWPFGMYRSAWRTSVDGFDLPKPQYRWSYWDVRGVFGNLVMLFGVLGSTSLAWVVYLRKNHPKNPSGPDRPWRSRRARYPLFNR